MRVVNSSFEFEEDYDGYAIIRKIERAGRTCYKSEDKITNDSAIKFVRKILSLGHESVIEHESITIRLICDRGVTHELVRHRIASYSQESTRYCNYGNNKFGREITVIRPFFWDEEDPKYGLWKNAMEECEKTYIALIDAGATPQEARSVLPNSLKTEIVITMNLREWRHFFKLRTSNSAHPQMYEVARPMLDKFKKIVPVVFDDISY